LPSLAPFARLHIHRFLPHFCLPALTCSCTAPAHTFSFCFYISHAYTPTLLTLSHFCLIFTRCLHLPLPADISVAHRLFAAHSPSFCTFSLCTRLRYRCTAHRLPWISATSPLPSLPPHTTYLPSLVLQAAGWTAAAADMLEVPCPVRATGISGRITTFVPATFCTTAATPARVTVCGRTRHRTHCRILRVSCCTLPALAAASAPLFWPLRAPRFNSPPLPLQQNHLLRRCRWFIMVCAAIFVVFWFPPRHLVCRRVLLLRWPHPILPRALLTSCFAVFAASALSWFCGGVRYSPFCCYSSLFINVLRTLVSLWTQTGDNTIIISFTPACSSPALRSRHVVALRSHCMPHITHRAAPRLLLSPSRLLPSSLFTWAAKRRRRRTVAAREGGRRRHSPFLPFTSRLCATLLYVPVGHLLRSAVLPPAHVSALLVFGVLRQSASPSRMAGGLSLRPSPSLLSHPLPICVFPTHPVPASLLLPSALYLPSLPPLYRQQRRFCPAS